MSISALGALRPFYRWFGYREAGLLLNHADCYRQDTGTRPFFFRHNYQLLSKCRELAEDRVAELSYEFDAIDGTKKTMVPWIENVEAFTDGFVWATYRYDSVFTTGDEIPFVVNYRIAQIVSSHR